MEYIPNRSRTSNTENCVDIVRKVVTDKLGVHLPAEMISVPHRLGTMPKTGPDNRSIIFRLVRRDLKYSIFRACRTKKPEFSINESVSPTRNTVQFVLRNARKLYPNKFGKNFTEEGNVRILLPKTDRSDQYEKRTINTKQALDELLMVKINKTSLGFGARWDHTRPPIGPPSEQMRSTYLPTSFMKHTIT